MDDAPTTLLSFRAEPRNLLLAGSNQEAGFSTLQDHSHSRLIPLRSMTIENQMLRVFE